MTTDSLLSDKLKDCCSKILTESAYNYFSDLGFYVERSPYPHYDFIIKRPSVSDSEFSIFLPVRCMYNVHDEFYNDRIHEVLMELEDVNYDYFVYQYIVGDDSNPNTCYYQKRSALARELVDAGGYNIPLNLLGVEKPYDAL